SGENNGRDSVAGCDTSNRAVPPAVGTVQMSPPDTKEISAPSGEIPGSPKAGRDTGDCAKPPPAHRMMNAHVENRVFMAQHASTIGFVNRFCRYQLRTTDVEGADAFYRDLLGDGFWGRGLDVGPLPAPLAARGVPANWLGHVGVEDVVPPMYRFLEAGATRLGAPPADGRDSAGVVLRDPSG